MHKLPFFDNLFVSVYRYLNSNMYLMLDGKEAVIIDPHYYNGIELFLRNYGIQKVVLFITHEHPDHISGIWWFQKKYECKLICSTQCAFKIAEKKYTRPLLISFTLEREDKKNGTNLLKEFKADYVWTTYKADITYDKSFQYEWKGHVFVFMAAEGHSVGSSIIVLEKICFWGGFSSKRISCDN